MSANQRDVAALVDDVSKAFGGIDIVVSNAGTHLPGRLDEIDERCCSSITSRPRSSAPGSWRAAWHRMRQRGGGRFIVIIGQAGKVPQANAIASTVINAAQHAFVKSLSDDLAPHGILVNAVCPSRIKSPLTRRSGTLHNEVYFGRSLEQQESKWGAEVPLGRWGTPEDIANAVAFLASERAGFHRRRQYRRRWRPPTVDFLAGCPAMIDLRHVSKTFRKRDEMVEAVRDISLTIAQKEIVAIIGPSGCGKSTLLNMIAGLYRAVERFDRLQGRARVRCEYRRRLHDAEGQPAAVAHRAGQYCVPA